MKIQVDIPKDLNKNLKIERIKREHKNMSETIIQILERYFRREKE